MQRDEPGPQVVARYIATSFDFAALHVHAGADPFAPSTEGGQRLRENAHEHLLELGHQQARHHITSTCACTNRATAPALTNCKGSCQRCFLAAPQSAVAKPLGRRQAQLAAGRGRSPEAKMINFVKPEMGPFFEASFGLMF